MKRQFHTFLRISGQGSRNFFRNAWLSTAATAVMLVTLTILLSTFAINMALGDTIEDIADDITISVYIYDDADEDRRNELENSLRNSYNVKDVEFVSKQDALEIFQDQNQDDPTILEGLSITDNVFPASYEVTIFDLTQIDSVVEVASREEFSDVVEETSVNEQRRKSIDRIASAQDFITVASLGAAGIFATISVLIIFNTIRMAVYTRAKEIEIMKLIGATRGYIRGPFLFEASMYGFFAGVLSLVIVYTVILVLGPKVTSHILFDPTIDFFVGHWPVIGICTIGTGILIGFVSSGLAMTRYLRFKDW